MFENGSFLRRRKRFKTVGGKRIAIDDGSPEASPLKPAAPSSLNSPYSLSNYENSTMQKPPIGMSILPKLSEIAPPPAPESPHSNSSEKKSFSIESLMNPGSLPAPNPMIPIPQMPMPMPGTLLPNPAMPGNGATQSPGISMPLEMSLIYQKAMIQQRLQQQQALMAAQLQLSACQY